MMTAEKTYSILIVSDEAESLLLATSILQPEGYKTAHVNNGVEALELLKRFSPDLILFNVEMPDGNGYEFCSRLQEDPELSYIPVLFLTPDNSEMELLKAFFVGAADIVAGPLSPEKLLEKVKKNLQKHEKWETLRQVNFPEQEMAEEPFAFLEKTRMLPWETKFLPSAFVGFKEHLLDTLRIASPEKDRFRKASPKEIYSVATEAGIEPAKLARSMSQFLNLEYREEIELAQLRPGILPKPFCKSYSVLSLQSQEETTVFVVSNPFNLELLYCLEKFCTKFRLILTEPANIERILDDRLTNPFARVEKELQQWYRKLEKIEPAVQTTENCNPVITLINELIEQACDQGASDIHLEPTENDVLVRFRVDGALRVITRLRPRGLIQALVTRIKVMSRLDIAECRLPQDGRISFKNFSRKDLVYDLRVSITPVQFGEKVVMRLINKQRSILSLDQLGFSDRNLKVYREKMKMPYGMILNVGPTGAGKSMTLYSALNEIRTPELNIQTVEDPIEYTLPDISQLQVNPEVGLTFDRALRSFLRQDPDVILVGEIRDRETADIAVKAALTGHLLLSTLHTRDAASTVARLVEMGIEPYMITASLVLVCAQRLLRRLCPQCKQPYKPGEGEKELLGLPPDFPLLLYRPVGCHRCGQTGYRGRIGIHEILVPDQHIHRAIHKGGMSAEMLKRLAVRRSGMTTLFWDGAEKVLDGICSLEDLVADIGVDGFPSRPDWWLQKFSPACPVPRI